jgi:Flp pilus assembly pilin Flp
LRTVNTLEPHGGRDDGATVVEYGVLLALVVGVVATIVATIGGSLVTQLTDFVNAWP